MSLKDDELLRAKEIAGKTEIELKEITLKHTSVKDTTSKSETKPIRIPSFFYFLKRSTDEAEPICI